MTIAFGFDDDDDDFVEKEVRKSKLLTTIIRIQVKLEREYLNVPYTKENLYRFKYYLAVAPIFFFIDFEFVAKWPDETEQLLKDFPVPLPDEITESNIKQLLKKCKAVKISSPLAETWKVLNKVCPDLNIPIEPTMKLGDEAMQEKKEDENYSQFRKNLSLMAKEYFNTIKDDLEIALNTARQQRMCPEFAYYTAIKWALTKGKGIEVSDYMLLFNMPIGKTFSDIELKKLLLELSNMGGLSGFSSNSKYSIKDLIGTALRQLDYFTFEV